MSKAIMACSLSCIDLTLEGLTAGLNLELASGMTALFTTSGEQETSLLARTLTGEQRPSHGSVRFGDLSLTELSRSQLLSLRRSIGVVSAQGGLISNLKLWENITLPLLFHGSTVPEPARRKIHSFLERFGFSGNIWALPGHLSLFERRMAAFIRAAVAGADYMIYAGCFDNLPLQERNLLLTEALALHRDNPGMVCLYLTASMTPLDHLAPDLHCNLRHQPAQITRNA